MRSEARRPGPQAPSPVGGSGRGSGPCGVGRPPQPPAARLSGSTRGRSNVLSISEILSPTPPLWSLQAALTPMTETETPSGHISGRPSPREGGSCHPPSSDRKGRLLGWEAGCDLGSGHSLGPRPPGGECGATLIHSVGGLPRIPAFQLLVRRRKLLPKEGPNSRSSLPVSQNDTSTM